MSDGESSESGTGFRINRKHVALTYSQCYIPDKETLKEAIDIIANHYSWEIEKWIIGQEFGEDGLNPHYHVSLYFKEKIDLKNPLGFDIPYNDAVYHPNVVEKKNKKAQQQWDAYCGKEKNYITNFWAPDPMATVHLHTVAENRKRLYEADPANAVKNLGRYERGLQAFSKRDPPISLDVPPYTNIDQNKVPQAMKDWAATWIGIRGRKKVLVIVGASQMGKTTWATGQGPYMVWSEKITAKNWDPTAKVIVWDDFKWEKIPQPKQYLLANGKVQLRGLYLEEDASITQASIVCMNPDDEVNWMRAWNDPSGYWKANAVYVRLENSLWRDDVDPEAWREVPVDPQPPPGPNPNPLNLVGVWDGPPA